jgi:broad specificity phosphatase PhoE
MEPIEKADATSESEGAARKVAGAAKSIFGGGDGAVIVTEEIREWDYGDYEGRKPAEVRADRKARGLDGENRSWSVWSDGCEGGE